MPGMTAPLFQGIAVGAFVVTALVAWRSELSRGAKVTTILTCLSAAACWVLRESEQGASLLGIPQVFLWLAFPAAGCFWAFVVCVFLDRPLRWLVFAPAALLLLSGLAITKTSVGANPAVLATFNIAAAAICLHAVYLIIRSWRGDLVDGRRISRFVILGIGALFAAAQGAAGALHWLGGGEAQLTVGGNFGAFAVSVLALAMGSVLLEAREGPGLREASSSTAGNGRSWRAFCRRGGGVRRETGCRRSDIAREIDGVHESRWVAQGWLEHRRGRARVGNTGTPPAPADQRPAGAPQFCGFCERLSYRGSQGSPG